MTNFSRTLAVAAAMLLPSAAFAQEMSARPFGQGSRIVSVGILTGGDYEGFGIGGSFEVGVKEFTPTLSLGVGAFAGFVRGDVGFTPGFDYTFTQVPIMAIGNLHLALPSQPKLDLYGGLSLGIIRTSVDYEGSAPGAFNLSESDSDVGLGIQIGARYAFTERTMGFAQLGANDIPLLYAGLSFKF
ncbi:MAG: outer membrane beta-barrel protein [Gemmatimonadota bacterium]